MKHIPLVLFVVLANIATSSYGATATRAQADTQSAQKTSSTAHKVWFYAKYALAFMIPALIVEYATRRFNQQLLQQPLTDFYPQHIDDVHIARHINHQNPSGSIQQQAYRAFVESKQRRITDVSNPAFQGDFRALHNSPIGVTQAQITEYKNHYASLNQESQLQRDEDRQLPILFAGLAGLGIYQLFNISNESTHISRPQPNEIRRHTTQRFRFIDPAIHYPHPLLDLR